MLAIEVDPTTINVDGLVADHAGVAILAVEVLGLTKGTGLMDSSPAVPFTADPSEGKDISYSWLVMNILDPNSLIVESPPPPPTYIPSPDISTDHSGVRFVSDVNLATSKFSEVVYLPVVDTMRPPSCALSIEGAGELAGKYSPDSEETTTELVRSPFDGSILRIWGKYAQDPFCICLIPADTVI